MLGRMLCGGMWVGLSHKVTLVHSEKEWCIYVVRVGDEEQMGCRHVYIRGYTRHMYVHTGTRVPSSAL